MISLRNNSGARFSIAGVALVVLLGAILFSKRSGATLESEGGAGEPVQAVAVGN